MKESILKLLYHAPVAFLVGCASTGVVPMGQNLYTISKTSPACGFRDAGGVRAEIFQEMTAFCSAKNLTPEVVTLEALDGVTADIPLAARLVPKSVAVIDPRGDLYDEDNVEDIYAELKKLKELLDAKIITQEEFDSRKKKIIAR